MTSPRASFSPRSVLLAGAFLPLALLAAPGDLCAQEAAAPEDPSPAQVEWLRRTAVPFSGVEAETGLDDLQPLRDMVGSARIVGLGEGTHGTREYFQMKHRLVEFLATEMGFTIFAIEANTPEAHALNDFVLHGQGDPAELIAGMHFWTWNTEEVLDMVRWMREFNRSGKGRIEFTGFDMQLPDTSAAIVTRFLHEVDPERAAQVAPEYTAMKKVARAGSGFGVVTYRFPVDQARGKHVTYRGYVKTQDLEDGWAGLWWWVDGADRKTLAFDNMSDRGPRGTSDWAPYAVDLDVPEDAVNINFGVLMPGRGEAWFDGLEIDLDGSPYAGSEFDLDFEGNKITGYVPSKGNYRADFDTTEIKSGKQSLRLHSVEPTESPGPDVQDAIRQAKDIESGLEAARKTYEQTRSPREVAWVIHNATIVRQCMELRGRQASRDQSMARNVAWIAEQNPDARIVLWAHNGHIAREGRTMGSYLQETFGENYLPVGFLTLSGSYYAMTRNTGGGEHPLTDPPTGAIERFFAATGAPRLILDTRTSKTGSDASGWVRETRPMRSIGALAMEDQFYPLAPYPNFDLLVYIARTHAARQIEAPPR